MYIMELENGERVTARMYGGALNFAEDTISLPIAEIKEFDKKRFGEAG